MATRYCPKVGDIIEYIGKRWVIADIKAIDTYGESYRCYLLDEDSLEEISFIPTNELYEKCINVCWKSKSSTNPYVKVGEAPYKIQNISYTKIIKVE